MARYEFTIEERSTGGKKGGKARAKVLTAKQRKEIARRAAAARWPENNGKGKDA